MDTICAKKPNDLPKFLDGKNTELERWNVFHKIIKHHITVYLFLHYHRVLPVIIKISYNAMYIKHFNYD